MNDKQSCDSRMKHNPDLDRLVTEVLASPKYRAVSPELVRAIGIRELTAHGRLKEAVKETKNKLHQVGAAYLDARPDYAAWLEELSAASGDPAMLRAACLALMRRHASTRERLPFLERFYGDVFGLLPPVRTVLDLACGLNPLARPWMPLAPGATYSACDIFADMVDFVGASLRLLDTPGDTWVCDLTAGAPDRPADLVLLLKTLPVLEQIERGSGLRLLKGLNVPAILVSYPAQSLGGRGKGMAAQYERQFEALTADRAGR
jgi:16S rRNA (guanine(1405)-N(7))-methyltransferase